jgi:hypothetical protein
MTAPLRLGGRAGLDDGYTVVWSVAEGRRGRRWREAVARDGALVRSILLEVSPVGRPTYLELATGVGLLTLHPDAEGREIHGNVVTSGGIRHLRFGWSLDHELDVVGSTAAAAVALQRLAGLVAVGEGRRIPVLRIDDSLEPGPAARRVSRTSSGGWHVIDLESDKDRSLILDDDGVPLLPGSVTWPLETD